MRINWATMMTTTASRRRTLLPQTLASVGLGGFPPPLLFLANATLSESGEMAAETGLTVVPRAAGLTVFGNFILGAWELYLRHPNFERYGLFQDDFTCVKNLRPYLDCCKFPVAGTEEDYPQGGPGYWNLYSFPANEALAPVDETGRRSRKVGFHRANQQGRGAVALVFDNDGMKRFLGSSLTVNKPAAASQEIATRKIDGGVVTAFASWCGREWTHFPSPVMHRGMESTLPTQVSSRAHPAWLATSYPGDSFDAMEWLKEK